MGWEVEGFEWEGFTRGKIGEVLSHWMIMGFCWKRVSELSLLISSPPPDDLSSAASWAPSSSSLFTTSYSTPPSALASASCLSEGAQKKCCRSLQCSRFRCFTLFIFVRREAAVCELNGDRLNQPDVLFKREESAGWTRKLSTMCCCTHSAMTSTCESKQRKLCSRWGSGYASLPSNRFCSLV